ncbi:MAG: hypothetical protein H8E17_11635 [Deltaproteobacteria bacterium]|nr:hypothetical protein [Deltaproteobacteria bacterium]
MKSCSFIKGSLFRKLQHVFKKHTAIGPIIDAESKRTTEDSEFTLEWLTEQVKLFDPDMLPVIQELKKDFQPALVVNRQSAEQQHVLVKNLISLCNEKLGVPVEHIGNLPDILEITDYLLSIPKYLDIPNGEFYLNAVKNIADKLMAYVHAKTDEVQVKTDFSDEEVSTIIKFMEGLDNSVFSGTKIEAWKLRMHFKPSTVIKFLKSKGISHELF